MPESPRPVVLLNAVGLTRRLLEHAPRLRALATSGWIRTLSEQVPAVTCSAQATLLTGVPPSRPGIVANGWLFRETQEVRFWQQANNLLQAEPVYATALRRAQEGGRMFRAAQLFWWFNQGAQVAQSVTPKPFYGADGNKAFGIAGTPDGLCERLEHTLGRFPFPSFWGPKAGLPCTEWIARCGAELVRANAAPDLTLVYLPHLDYDPQRYGPSGCDMPALVRQLDDACAPLLDACHAAGARVWVVSEYGHCDVRQAVEPNRLLRKAGWLTVRPGPFGESLDLFASRAFAVCDHQLAHVYVRDPSDVPRVSDALRAEPGVARLLAGPERAELGLDHPRSGEIVALSEPEAWFAYPFWLDDRHAPDYARTVDIHRKPGYDPCELLFDPAIRFPSFRAARRLLRKKLGFRTLFDLVPLDPRLVRGSHGLAAAHDDDRPILVADGPCPAPSGPIAMTRFAAILLEALGLPD